LFFHRHGGVVPPVARNLHSQYIEQVVNDAIKAAQIDVAQVDAIATTVKPGKK
jgi:N6-L-threonylcarbamoyladenine synthase